MTKAPTGLPERSPRGVAGYNSTLLAICDAPRCGREFEVSAKSDDLPYHHAPGARGLLKPVCHGSGRRASVFVEPAKGA